MKEIRQNGFVLIAVVVVVATTAAEMLVLAGLAKTMLFETRTAHVQAVQRNLMASGLIVSGYDRQKTITASRKSPQSH